MEKKAIAYTTDIILGNTGMVIDRASERKRIEEYAKENGITIVAWFEEEVYEENPTARPKLNAALACTEPHELVLVERVWAISRKWKEIQGVIKLFETKNARVESTTTLWDCVSMMARNHYRTTGRVACAVEDDNHVPESINLVETYGRATRKERTLVLAAEGQKASVRKPAHLAFQKIS